MSENIKKGGISVETQNIFPVIKKWLYSDKDIFVRELVSNACDAVTKHKRLVSLGEAEASGDAYRIDVVLDTELSTLTFSDNGIGMDEDEVDRYINQIALSGALDFIEKYEGKSEEASSGIIGHFGLGFYSAFMIADKVEIITKSYKGGSTAVHWIGLEDGSYEMTAADKEKKGTDIVLHINQEEKEYVSEGKIREILDRFCSFMPVEIYYSVLGKEDADKQDEESKEQKPVNDTTPLWLKKPSECTDEEYKEFYKKLFLDYKDPLFWIHISADYPLNFKGILYFPKYDNEFGNYEGQVKLYYNQVFVADNIKEVIPEYMFLLKGVLDCPELPLNVSRSYLQSNGYVSKISAHIVKKVSDKLVSLFNNDRENYENFWQDIKPFVEYACMRDDKFFTKVCDSVIYKTVEDKYVTIKEYAQGDGFDKNVYYTDDKLRQSKYIGMFKDKNISVIELDKVIDVQFISFAEMKYAQSEELKDVKFVRVDAGFADALKNDDAQNESTDYKELCEFFTNTLGKGDELKIECNALSDDSVPALLKISEQSRRMADMMKMYGNSAMMMGMKQEETLVLNISNTLVAKINKKLAEKQDEEKCKDLAKQVYMLSVVAQRPLEADELASFISDTASLLSENL